MKVFVAGATGVIGRRLVPLLVGAGHEVTGMTRSKANAERLRGSGVTPAVCDALDAEAVATAVTRAEPEVVIHELTDLPPAIDLRKKEVYAATNRLRREGTRNLVRAAGAAGARRVVAQSIAFAYAPTGPATVDEDHPLYLDAPPPWVSAVQAVDELERIVVGEGDRGPEGVVLRYGFFYGPGSAYASDGHFAHEVRRRRLPIVGGGDGVFSLIHVDDAAAATVAALEHGDPGVYNVVDDEPAPMREWVPVYANVLDAKRPLRVPKPVARLVAGEVAVMMATRLRGASNERAKRELGWQPRYSSWRTGFREALG